MVYRKHSFICASCELNKLHLKLEEFQFWRNKKEVKMPLLETFESCNKICSCHENFENGLCPMASCFVRQKVWHIHECLSIMVLRFFNWSVNTTAWFLQCIWYVCCFLVIGSWASIVSARTVESIKIMYHVLKMSAKRFALARSTNHLVTLNSGVWIVLSFSFLQYHAEISLNLWWKCNWFRRASWSCSVSMRTSLFIATKISPKLVFMNKPLETSLGWAGLHLVFYGTIGDK